ncbi:MAG: sugar transferase [Bacteroidales bacterium]|nr:sugar transferase [Bacteroidales bacterium]
MKIKFKKIYSTSVKRMLDLLVSLIALPFVGIIIILVGLIIYLLDRGSVFYNAKRLGRNGIPFTMYKFRTMTENAPDIRLPDGSTYNAEDDPRVTRTGRFLRSTSIDEIPQIINVFLGDMSFIGPRPDPIDWLDKYVPDEKIFLSVRPGITGYNQAFFRNCADGKTKIENDVYYAINISFFLDLKIVLRTFRTLIFRENIYVDDSRKSGK